MTGRKRCREREWRDYTTADPTDLPREELPAMTQIETTTKTGVVIIVGRDESIGYGKWGRGETVEQALRTFLKVGGSTRHGYTILEFAEADQFKGIDALGDVHYTGESPRVTEVPARKKR